MGSSDVLWAWYLELERTAAGEWVPCSTLYHYAVSMNGGWCGEGHLRGTVTVDSREPRAVRCRLDLQAEGGELTDASVFFTADPEEDSQDLAEFLEAGTGKALGLK